MPTLTPSVPDLVLVGRAGSELAITYVKNAGFLIESGDRKILIDALFEGFGQPLVSNGLRLRMEQAEAPFDGVDLVLVTHTHADHFDPAIVGAHLQNNPPAVLLSTDEGARIIRQTFSTLEGLEERVHSVHLSAGTSQELDVNGFPLRILEISHGEGADVRNYGYVFEIGGYKLFHTGDIGGLEYLQRYDLPAEQIDFAFVPWFFVADPENHVVLEDIQAKHYVPMHFYYTGSDLESIWRDVEAHYPEAILFRESMQKLVVQASTSVATAGYEPVFEASGCHFEVPAGYYPECGFLVVPEDRSQPDGPQIKLHVAIFESASPDPLPDPVIYLAGGGGANQLDMIQLYLDNGGDEILKNRDYIFYNQRGARYNEPSLNCPGYIDMLWELAGQDLSLEEREAQEIEFLLSCHDDLLAQGHDLSQYNSVANAADLNDLCLALDYDQINIYGTSYGTRLALEVMRDHPEGIRSAIIDSVYPPQVPIYGELAANANRAFEKLFEDCAADGGCRQAHPDLEGKLYRSVDELNVEPRTLTFSPGEVHVDGGVVLDALFGFFYWASAIPYIPRDIDMVAAGDLSDMAPVLRARLYEDTINWGVHYSLVCHEVMPAGSYEEALASAANLPPQIANCFATPFRFTLCESWQSGTAEPSQYESVVSDIPTLVLAGSYDPITPPAYSRLAAETLSNSFYYEFPAHGHGVMRAGGCGTEIGLAFLDDPTSEPDSSCMEDLTAPDFR
jgi:L-ascorbate metabolism protein UlaG (beta-lactamase superfamily)/pimeloyl-ACP methyl ester carboxylesterase